MIRRFLVVPAACVLLLLGADVASAGAGAKVVVSLDGRTWAPSLRVPLFDPAVLWVPGENRTAELYVGNRAQDAGVLALVARADDADGLVAAREVSLEVRRGAGAWTRIAADGRAHRLAGGELAAGANVRLAIRVSFAPTSPNASQLRRLPLSFDVVLSESGTAVAAPAGGGGGHGGLLPDTGGVERVVLIAGLLLVVLGAAVIRSAMSPREKEDDEHAPV